MISGALTRPEIIEGTYSTNGSVLSGISNTDSTISGSLTAPSSIEAELSTKNIADISGDLSNASALVGELDIVSSSDIPPYTGDYVVTPKANDVQTLETRGKLMGDDVTVLQVPIYETTNEAGGTTVYIAMEV